MGRRRASEVALKWLWRPLASPGSALFPSHVSCTLQSFHPLPLSSLLPPSCSFLMKAVKFLHRDPFATLVRAAV